MEQVSDNSRRKPPNLSDNVDSVADKRTNEEKGDKRTSGKIADKARAELMRKSVRT